MSSHKRKKSEILVVSADTIREGDQVWVYGQWLVCTKTKPLFQNRYNFSRMWFAEFPEAIVVPAGWKIEIRKVEDSSEVSSI